MSQRVYVTMDQDWACDGVMNAVIDLMDTLGIPVTIFMTNDTPVLARLREDPLFSLGIHPNFTPQLNGLSQKPFTETLREMKELIPEAKDIRCHAIVDATPILAAAREMGFERDANLFIPFSSGITLKPFTHFTGIRRLPYFYEDDAWALEENAADARTHLMEGDGLKIFNFHPIHLFLNTETMDRYQRAKAFYHDFEGLKPFINPEPNGARSFLTELSRLAAENEIAFGRLDEL